MTQKKCLSSVIPVLLLGFIMSCSYHPFVPPGDIAYIESPSTVGKNRISIVPAGGFAGALFDGVLYNGNVNVKYGCTGDTEVGISAFGLYLSPSENTYAHYNHLSYGATFSAKIALVPNTVSLKGGLGYGLSDLGNYTTTDLGFIFGLNNRYLIPIVQIIQYIGFPVNPVEHDLSLRENDLPGEHLYTPSNTVGLLSNIGIKLPLDRWMKHEKSLALYAFFGMAQIWDDESHNSFYKMSFGVDYSFSLDKNK